MHLLRTNDVGNAHVRANRSEISCEIWPHSTPHISKSMSLPNLLTLGIQVVIVLELAVTIFFVLKGLLVCAFIDEEQVLFCI